MLRVRLAFALGFVCVASSAFAADVPYVSYKPLKMKAFIKKSKVALHRPEQLMPVAVLPKVLPGSITQTTKDQTQVTTASTKVSPSVIELPWVLNSLVATADGGKREGSAAAEGNLVTNRPGTDFGPDVVIELSGHVIKTAQATVRLDIRIGALEKSVLWSSDDIKSGAFQITLNEKLESGPMPIYFPASVLAFVTQQGDGHVAMVSLEKVVFRMGVTAATQ